MKKGEDNPPDGLIQAKLWLTPQQTRIVHQLVIATSRMSAQELNWIEQTIKSAIEVVLNGPDPKIPKNPKR